MVKTHEINLDTTNFNMLLENEYIILENKDKKFEINDYILFRQIGTSEEGTTEIISYQITQIRNVIDDSGLKDNHILIMLKKIN